MGHAASWPAGAMEADALVGGLDWRHTSLGPPEAGG